MATPTPEDILEIFEDLNYPNANKLRRPHQERVQGAPEGRGVVRQTPDAHATLCKGAHIPGQDTSKSTL